ncbi:MAG: ceramidase [Gallionella sp.]|nr:ceramidase [Gallionella sp.]
MIPASTVNAVGYYCGRFEAGLLGEPQNSFSNLAFIAGAMIAWVVWRQNPARDPWQLLLFVLAAAIGVGSFIFHSAPTTATLMMDLVPVQVFGLTYLAYVCVRYLRMSMLVTAALVIGFFLARQYWIAVTPRGALGGGITHVPSLLALIAVGAALLYKRIRVGRYILFASIAYVSGILVRSWDLYICPSFPLGVHWLWHFLTALAATLLVYGAAKMPPNTSLSGLQRQAATHVKS